MSIPTPHYKTSLTASQPSQLAAQANTLHIYGFIVFEFFPGTATGVLCLPCVGAGSAHPSPRTPPVALISFNSAFTSAFTSGLATPASNNDAYRLVLESQDSRPGQVDSMLRDIPVYCHLKRVELPDGDMLLEINYIFFLACASPQAWPHKHFHRSNKCRHSEKNNLSSIYTSSVAWEAPSVV